MAGKNSFHKCRPLIFFGGPEGGGASFFVRRAAGSKGGPPAVSGLMATNLIYPAYGYYFRSLLMNIEITLVCMKKHIIMLLVAIQGIVQAQTMTGKASHVYDGDSFRLYQSDGSFLRVRLANIDAPEIQQPYGLLSKLFLDSLIDEKIVEIQITATDKYGRKVALLNVDGQQINKLLVANGLAWNYPKYSTDLSLISVENQARAKKTGLWRDENPTAPWHFRARR